MPTANNGLVKTLFKVQQQTISNDIIRILKTFTNSSLRAN